MAASLAQLRKADGIIRLHGHRGARGIWPENTIFGFKGTFDLGVQVVELDVLLSQDNIAVITHNPTLMPATTRDQAGVWISEAPQKVSDLPYAKLRQFDIGGTKPDSDYASSFPEQSFLFGQSIPTLDELAKLVQTEPYKDTWLNIEIKSIPIHAGLTPEPELLARKVIEVVQNNALSDRVILQSFDWRVLEHVKRLAPDLPRSHLSYMERSCPKMETNIYPGSPWMAGAETHRADSDLCDVIADAGGHLWAPHHSDVVAEEVARAQAHGLIVNAWTVNTIAEIDHVIDAGVDGIITDYPGRVQKRLIERGYHWREDFAQKAPHL
ncbi:glycerophosphodiester phosphodiesterase [Sulfitobacter donghicola]|uniref:Glycerophosphoryl diester phosphodiesterase n=1 Tax=Sulfitobacter donghicola DSW-25 = KCTC 12864 = JCM 14565 TaxID=1300350 RepID=A0A073IGM8_9RHOB|nr:glycerophosphodiester phosphodiesterase [Sulfitobacter donghicola]KEJ88954.1 glycerophosphoryl diester phosphodiesterase [Sulfitobacter donghicola DSW-25 = KCTC 12864 = JCM 14565]KIN67499.1 Glycerophosphoryl diester phosphodiesterase [Sulfitobacter donghicola DSW-25 = KCTC 12864 = JCM 14565]